MSPIAGCLSPLHITRTLRAAFAVSVIAVLTACGGGSDDAAVAVTPPPGVSVCLPFADSFGREVTCDSLRTLAGSELAFVAGGSGTGGDGSGEAGADGTAGDGAPIPNADLEFKDIDGKTVRAKTDANGYYRINLRGMKAPLVATVLRNEKPWKSMLVSDIVRAPENRKFYTINLTGLTDVVAFETAKKQGLTSADALTPAVVNAQKAAIPQIIANLNAQLAVSLKDAGLDAATFNPLTTPFVTNKAGYDQILETNPIGRNPDGTTTLVNTKFSFTTGDRRVYRITPTNGVPFLNTRTILSTLGTEVERLENTFSDGSPSTVTLYDSQVRQISNVTSEGRTCTFSPPLEGFVSLAAARLKVGESIAQTGTQTCVTAGESTSFPFTGAYTLTGVETVSTPAGRFSNARVWTFRNGTATSGFRTVIWVDTVMNRAVFESRFQTINGVEAQLSSLELISFSIKNYPK